MMTFFFRYLIPRFLRLDYYFKDIKAIRERYSFGDLSIEANAQRLKEQMEAAEYWRVK